ncbi:MAG: DegT/DnrJ/EryC1/StrS family aminotransferase [Flavobacteriales bacterium]
MVDLHGQYRAIKADVDTAIQAVIDNTTFISGPDVKSFASELEQYLGVKHVIPCANGTDALQMAMMALNLKPGDEVITASFTFVATAEVIALLNLTPVLVEVDPDTFCVQPDAIRKAITPKTKAIVPVHLFGQNADMDEIMAIAKEYDLFVIEDGCQSIGADYFHADGRVSKSGTIGHIGTTSFFPSKNLGCYGDGGAIFTQDDAIAERLRMIANHGMKVRYHHEMIGVNSRLDTMQAAILRVKLRHLDKYNNARRSAAEAYDRAFANHPNFKIPVRSTKSSHVFHQYTLVTCGVDRPALQAYLAEHGIPSMVYYPIPLHLQEAYRHERYPDGSLPVTEMLSKCVISLPMHTELSTDQIQCIVDRVLEFASH